MINRYNDSNSQIIMRFGQAALVQTPEGKYELRGGSKDERTEAKEFVSLFMHEAIISFVE